MLFLLTDDLKRIIRNIWFWIGIGIGFLLLFLVFFAGKSQGEVAQEQKVAVGVINNDTSIYSRMVTSMFLDNEGFIDYLTFYIEDADSIHERFQNGELDMYLEIPENFAESMVYLEHLPVEVVISTRSLVIELLLKNLMEGYSKYIEAVEINCVSLYDIMLDSGMSKEAAKKMNDRISLKLITMALGKDRFFADEITDQPYDISFLFFYLHELVYLVTGFLALLCGVRFQKEYHSGILRRLNMVGKSVFLILIERWLLFALLSGMFFGLSGLIAAKSGAHIPGEVWFVCWSMAVLLDACMLVFAAGFEKKQSYLLASNLFLLLGALLGGGIIPYMYLPQNMSKFATLFPNFWFLKTVFSAWMGELTGNIWFAQGVCIGCCMLLLTVASVLYRRKGGMAHGDL